VSSNLHLFSMHKGDAQPNGADTIANVLDVLQKYNVEVNEYGDYQLDALGLDISAKDLNEDAEGITLQGVPVNLQVVYDIAKFGQLTIANPYGSDTLEKPTFIAVTEQQFTACQQIDGCENPVLAQSAAHLYSLL